MTQFEGAEEDDDFDLRDFHGTDNAMEEALESGIYYFVFAICISLSRTLGNHRIMFFNILEVKN